MGPTVILLVICAVLLVSLLSWMMWRSSTSNRDTMQAMVTWMRNNNMLTIDPMMEFHNDIEGAVRARFFVMYPGQSFTGKRFFDSSDWTGMMYRMLGGKKVWIHEELYQDYLGGWVICPEQIVNEEDADVVITLPGQIVDNEEAMLIVDTRKSDPTALPVVEEYDMIIYDSKMFGLESSEYSFGFTSENQTVISSASLYERELLTRVMRHL